MFRFLVGFMAGFPFNPLKFTFSSGGSEDCLVRNPRTIGEQLVHT